MKNPQAQKQGDDLQLLSGAEYEQVASPELNDNFEELLERWQEHKAKHAYGAASHRLGRQAGRAEAPQQGASSTQNTAEII